MAQEFGSATVRVEYSQLGGHFLHAQCFKPSSISIQESRTGTSWLKLGGSHKGEVSVPLAAPLCVVTANILDGRMTLQFPRARMRPSAPPQHVQVMISAADPDMLAALRDSIGGILGRVRPGGPPQSTHKPYKVVQKGVKRKAELPQQSGGVSCGIAPGIGRSFCSREASGGLGSVSFALGHIRKQEALLKEDEPLPPLSREQRVVLDQVLSGKNVFFSGPAGLVASRCCSVTSWRRSPPETTFVSPPRDWPRQLWGHNPQRFCGSGSGGGLPWRPSSALLVAPRPSAAGARPLSSSLTKYQCWTGACIE
eukprot:jgi/Botrbrau1/3203/Bobra.37_2s0033.1